MKKIIVGILTALVFLGCSSDKPQTDVEPQLVVEKSLGDLKLNDQFGKEQTLDADTKTVIFAFSKDVGHTCNDFFATKNESYLKDHKAVFVADVSGAPSLIRSMFILPGLKDFKHTILVIDDAETSAKYKPAHNSEKIVVVDLDNKKITDIKFLNSPEELDEKLQKN